MPPVKFPTTVDTGPEPPEFSRGPAANEIGAALLRLVEQDRDVVGALVGDHQVGQGAGEVGHRDPDRVGADEVAIARR